MDTQERVSTAKMMEFMYTKGLSMEGCKAWSTAEHAAAAACYFSDDASYARARQLLKDTVLGVAAVGVRDEGWQTPAALDWTGNHAGMQNYAARRTQYKADYAGHDDYFDYTYGVAGGRDRGDGLNAYNFELAYWLDMLVLPLALVSLCDNRGRHSAFARLENWSTAECVVRADIFACEEAIDMMEAMVVLPWTTGAGCYTDKPLFFVDAFSIGQSSRIRAMVAYLPEDNDLNKIQAAFRVMAVIYVRSGLALPHMTAYQMFKTMANVAGFAGAPEKNIGPRSSASQGILECSRLCEIETVITEGQVEVKIHHAPAKVICDIWNVPGALAETEAAALDAFGAAHYEPRPPPWNGGVTIEFSDDEEEETSDDSDDDAAIKDEFSAMTSSQLRQAMEARGIGRSANDSPADIRQKLRAYDATAAEAYAATPSSEQELTPDFLRNLFFGVSLYPEALQSGEVEKVLTAVGARVDDLVDEDPSAARVLYLELKRARGARGGKRTGGPANLAKIWNVVPRSSWDPKSKRFLERALKARAGLEMTTRDVPRLYDDDRKLIYDPSDPSSNGFQELLEQYRKDIGSGRAHSKLQKSQKLAGSLEAMYEELAPRRRS